MKKEIVFIDEETLTPEEIATDNMLDSGETNIAQWNHRYGEPTFGSDDKEVKILEPTEE